MPDQFQSFNTQRVLLIEKSAYIQEALKETMYCHGIELHCTETGENGIQAMSRNRFGAVVCNYHLPGMNGLEFFWKTKELLANTVTILIASSGDDYLANAARESGVDFFMEMPFKVEDLLDRLKGQRPRLKRSIDEFGFLSSIQNYSIASRLRLRSTGVSAITYSPEKSAQCISRRSKRSRATLKVFHNSKNFSSKNTLRANLKLVKGQSRKPASCD